MSGTLPCYEQIGVAMTCRSYAEYERMFAFDRIPLSGGPVLDVAAGASSFTAEAGRRGIPVYAADPMYGLSPEEIGAHGTREIAVSTEKLGKIRHVYDWSFYGSPEEHRERREKSLQAFVEDFRSHAKQGRYVPARLPELPFDEGTFGDVLISHFLFLYHEQFDYDFHLRSVLELTRVCRPGGQVRIYPLFTFRWERYPMLERLLEDLSRQGIEARLEASELPFIPGSTEFLCLRK
ncbi:class I SAM-dependent methyltransferase [Paenibacillus filicis]|uniref:Class I SAM-dependent methyltransferase n=1 Tax=Paenibacillus gyeongsangnamensis TaxID=3388067 RepID=A0ABT4Q5I5_9BACL|nr:class I SAM-dependent methyltransferase [Paenibacillus filicis]MCZ8512061.1 class I SAM-dependent methyltransferase [Paenibacillus filicis]